MYRALFEAIGEPIEIWRTTKTSPTGELVAQNPAAQRLGFSDDEARRSCLEAGAPIRVGQYELVPSPLDAAHVAIHIRDLSLELRAERLERDEQRVRESLDVVEHARTDSERFTYLLSHDLQEPLRIAGMYAQLLERRAEDALDDLSRRHLATVLTNLRRMHGLIDDLLALSRAEREPIPSEPVDLQALVARLVEALPAEPHDLHIRWAALPTVTGSEPLLREAFSRLLTNAVMYRSAAPLEVSLEASRVDDRWRVVLADNGVGIDPAFHEMIFQPFKRLHGYEAYPGTGMGLAICRRAIERHGGALTVESEPGAGARFTIELPVRP